MPNSSKGLLQLGETPNFPFVGQTYEIPVHLVDGLGHLKSDEVSVNVRCHYADDMNITCPESFVKIHTAMPVLITKGTAIVKMEVLEASMNYEDKKFVLIATVDRTNSTTPPAISEPMLAVQYRLTIDHTTPDIWYKDEGGRDKCIEINVNLVNKEGRCSIERKVPLKVSLHYSNGALVARQDILKVNPESKLLLDKKGSAIIKVRIEDVSKNHQNQAFSVMIAADTVKFPLNNDISPALSTSIDIRSKRKVKLREGVNSGKRSLDDMYVEEVGQYNSVNGFFPHHNPAFLQFPFPMQYDPSQSGAKSDSDTDSRDLNTKEQAATTSQEELIPKHTHPLFINGNTSSTVNNNIDGLLQGAALSGLIEWANYTLEKLHTVKWDHKKNGKIEISNPNAIITDIEDKYVKLNLLHGFSNINTEIRSKNLAMNSVPGQLPPAPTAGPPIPPNPALSLPLNTQRHFTPSPPVSNVGMSQQQRPVPTAVISTVPGTGPAAKKKNLELSSSQIEFLKMELSEMTKRNQNLGAVNVNPYAAVVTHFPGPAPAELAKNDK